jgi:hypothetical protein
MEARFTAKPTDVDACADNFILTSDSAGVDFVGGGGTNMSRTIPAHPAEITLPETIDHRAKLYSLVAAAAGVSMLALAQPAEAEIIITNKTIPIQVGTPLLLDLNGDGTADFSFYLASNSSHGTVHLYSLFVNPLEGGEVIGETSSKFGRRLASALVRGAKIGPGGPFRGSQIEESNLCLRRCGTTNTNPPYSFDQHLYGDWGGSHPNRFLGVKFLIKSETHYGWVRMTVTVQHKGNGSGPKGSFSGTITEYGYESIANKPCYAGLAGNDPAADRDETGNSGASLGMLALGSDGLALWRPEP